MILVSHDRHLLEACADRLWLVADGKVTPFDGDLDDYRRRCCPDSGQGITVGAKIAGARRIRCKPAAPPPTNAPKPRRCANGFRKPKP